MFDAKANIIAASPFCFFGFDPFVAYRYLPRAGIRHVEIPALPPSMGIKYGLTTFAPELMDEADVKSLKDRLAELGLTPLTIATLCDLLDARQIEMLRRRIDFGEQLGAQYVIADAIDRPGPDEQHRKALNAIHDVADYAADHEIRIAVEIHDGPTRNGLSSRKFLEEVDHSNVGINYDTGNIYYYNDHIDPAEDIRHILDRVVHVHLKDTTGGKGQWQFCALGEGRVNFPKIIEALQSVGFRGPYSLEIEGQQGEDLNREGHLARVMKSVNYLRQIGLMPPA